MDSQSIQSQSEEYIQKEEQSYILLEEMNIEGQRFGDKRTIIKQKQLQKKSVQKKMKIQAQINQMENILKAIQIDEEDKILIKGQGNQKKILILKQQINELQNQKQKNSELIIQKLHLVENLQNELIEIRSKNYLRKKESTIKLILYKFYQTPAKKEDYFKNLQFYSKKVKRNLQINEVRIDTIKNQIYKKELKIQFLQTYRLFINEQNDTVNIEKAWKLIRKHYFNLFENSKIFFLVFSFPDPSVQKKYRYFLIRNLFKQTFQLLKKSQKNYKTLAELLQSKSEMYHLLYIFAARQSFVYYDNLLKKDLKELEITIKDSWYIRWILCQFLKGRQRKLNQIRKIKFQQVITQDIVKEKLKQIKIYYVDYPNQLQGGQTDTSDPLGQFPIYINSYSDFENFKYNHDCLHLYFFCTILHEIQHSIVRKIGLVKPEENSYPKYQQSSIKTNKPNLNKKKQQRSQMDDGGMLLQCFAFGGRMRIFREYDYRVIKKLLEFKQNPFPQQSNSIWDCEENFKLCQDMGIINSQNKQLNQDVQKEQDQDQEQDQIIQTTNKTKIKKINTQINKQINEIQQKILIIQQNFLSNEIQEKIHKSPSDNDTEFEKKQTEYFFDIFSQMAQQKYEEQSFEKQFRYQSWQEKKKKQKQKQIQKQSEKGQQQNNNIAQIKQMIKIFQKMGCESYHKNQKPKRAHQKTIKKRTNSISQDQSYLNHSIIIQRNQPCIVRRKRNK